MHWLTPELGRVATVAKGARRPKSPFAGKLDLFYGADFSFSRSRGSDLHNLREVNLRETHGAIREDILKLQQAAYATAFIEQTTETETPLPEIFDLVRDFWKALCEHKTSLHMVYAFELKLLHEMGMEPDMDEARLTPGAKKIVAALLANDWASIVRLKLANEQDRELHQWLHGFLIFQLDKLPRGRNAALSH